MINIFIKYASSKLQHLPIFSYLQTPRYEYLTSKQAMASSLSIVNDNSSHFTNGISKLHLHDIHLISNQFHGNMYLELLELLFREQIETDGVKLYTLPVFYFSQSTFCLVCVHWWVLAPLHFWYYSVNRRWFIWRNKDNHWGVHWKFTRNNNWNLKDTYHKHLQCLPEK